MNKVKFTLLAAGFAFALAFTFSCSSGDEAPTFSCLSCDDDDGGGSDSGSGGEQFSSSGGINNPNGVSSSSVNSIGYCLYSNNCYNYYESQCNSLGGSFYTSLSACESNIPSTGYCLRNNNCYNYYESQCNSLGGNFYTSLSVCESNIPSTGYCLYSNNCYNYYESQCNSLGGSFYTNSSACESNIPPVPIIGACYIVYASSVDVAVGSICQGYKNDMGMGISYWQNMCSTLSSVNVISSSSWLSSCPSGYTSRDQDEDVIIYLYER